MPIFSTRGELLKGFPKNPTFTIPHHIALKCIQDKTKQLLIYRYKLRRCRVE